MRLLKLSDLEIIESNKLTELTKELILSLQKNHRFTEENIKKIHRKWLQDMYSLAGHYRTINMSKGGFIFTAAHLVPKLMQDFEKDILV